MKVTGSHVVHAARQQVWDALQDPAVLVQTIPGCRELEEIGDHTYAARVHAGVASITGTYEGRVALDEQHPPTSYTLRASGSGAPGTIEAMATVRLTETADGDTQVDYDADAVIGGAVGGVGQRVLAAVAQRNAVAFFEAVNRHLAGAVEAAEVSAPEPPPTATVHRRAVEPEAGTHPAHLVLAALIGAAIALLGVLIGRRTRP